MPSRRDNLRRALVEAGRVAIVRGNRFARLHDLGARLFELCARPSPASLDGRLVHLG